MKLIISKTSETNLTRLFYQYADLNLKRFYSLDTQVYHNGALPAKVKELMGLVASLVLRCDDCITYHLIQCYEKGVSDEELKETVTIGLAAGGSITIPHLRRLFQTWDEMKKANK